MRDRSGGIVCHPLPWNAVFETSVDVIHRINDRTRFVAHAERGQPQVIDETYTYCPSCGAIACTSHTKTERLESEPVCTGCAVTARFALKTKYFYDEQNLEAFREEYADMPLHEKAMENTLLVGGGIVTTLLVILGLLVTFGVI